jgi:hypothetical protein
MMIGRGSADLLRNYRGTLVFLLPGGCCRGG